MRGSWGGAWAAGSRVASQRTARISGGESMPRSKGVDLGGMDTFPVDFDFFTLCDWFTYWKQYVVAGFRV